MTNKTVEFDNAVEFNVQPYLGFDFTPFNHYILYCGFDKHWFKQNAQMHKIACDIGLFIYSILYMNRPMSQYSGNFFSSFKQNLNHFM